MFARLWLGAALVLLLCLAVAPPAQAQPPFEGSDYCFTCHPSQYNDWRVSGHPYKIVPTEEAYVRPIPLPSGFWWDEISYVIGGYKWKSRYMGTDGYIITTVFDPVPPNDPIDGMNQYNYMTDQWVDYHAGEVEKPYNCGRCHTTGWVADEDAETDGDLSDNQDGLPGIWGTWEFPGIQCEECHGPGDVMWVDDSAEACGACHIRSDPLTIPAKGGFIRHHEQYNEHLASPHANMDCVECHDPHKKGEFSIIQTCEDCHGSIADSYALTSMGAVGVRCEDCHMPWASKSATALGPYKGDVRTHLFNINVRKNARMFTEDGLFVLLDSDGQGATTLDFSCQYCHLDRNMNWLARSAKNFHFQSMAKAPAPTYEKEAVAPAPRTRRKGTN